MALSLTRDRSIVCHISFDGLLGRKTRATLFNELVKYILYEKSQMPEMFDQLKRNSHVRGKHANPKSSNKVDRQAFLLFSSCQKLFADITSAFQDILTIKESIIILGSSPTSPKEVYHIDFPTSSPAGLKHLSSKESKPSLFLQIFAQDPFHVGQKLGLTNLYVLLLLPRDTKLLGFTAKPIFKVSSRGQHYHLKLTCKADENSVLNSPKLADMLLNISGIVPLDSDDANKSSQPIANDDEFFQLLDDENDEDYVWFQANVSVKGYQLS